MTRIDENADEIEARLNRRLRVAGVVAILAAALGSVSVSAAAPGPLTDDDCTMSLQTGGGFTTGCDGESADDAADVSRAVS